VENAILHAIAPRAAGGTLRLRVTGGEAQVTVTVADDGPGADASRVATATGVGLDAVRRRLAASGSARRLELETAPGAGFVARVVLPEPT
jgi:signal transduction histidine kinase